MTTIVRDGIEFEITELTDDSCVGTKEDIEAQKIKYVKLNGICISRADIEFYLRALISFYKNKEMKVNMEDNVFKKHAFDLIDEKRMNMPTCLFNREDIDKPFFGLFPEIVEKENDR